MNNELDNYLKKLYKQYIASLGVDSFSNKDRSLNFNNWLKILKQRLKDYRNYLGNYVKPEMLAAEIGKGEIDTISTPNSKIILLTPYTKTFKKLDYDKREFLKGKLDFQEKVKILYRGQVKKDLIPEENSYIVSHNPYNYKEVRDCLLNLNDKGFNVCLGMFGNLSDFDYPKKLSLLKEFAQQSDGELIQTSVSNDYFSFVDVKVKRK